MSDNKEVARANASFMPSPKTTPDIKEVRQSTSHTPKHPMDIFTILQNENPWVDLSIRSIAGSAAAVIPLFTIRGNKKQKGKIDYFKQKLMHPNPQMTGYELFYQTYADLATYGNCYWQIIKDRKGDLHSIYRIPAPNVRVRAHTDSDNNLMLFYVIENPDRQVFDETEIVHFKLPNPDSFLYGKPLFYPNIANITIDESVTTWVKSFFEKAYSGGAIFKMEADETVAVRNRQWLKEEYTKPENAGKPLLLEGDLELVSDGSKFKDLNYAAMKQMSREEIMQHAGVPLSVAGVRSNSGQANIEVINSEQEAFIRTMDLYHNIVFSRLEQYLFQTIFNEYNLTIEPGMHRRFTNKMAADLIQAASQVAVTVNEHRRALNLEPIPDECGGNTYIVKTNNGIVACTDTFGIDFNTGERTETLIEKQQKFQERMADKQAKVKNAKQPKQPGSSNTASNTSNTGGRKETRLK